MNLPNKLTILRVILIPVFIVMMELPGDAFKAAALIIFIAASITDTLDGYIARKYNLITDFGKFMDPLADKLLVCSALILFVQYSLIAPWIVIVIISREFIISGFRLVAADNGLVIAASMWGKIKTVCQMIMTIALICDFPYYGFWIFEQILIYASLILTVVSLADYLIKNRRVCFSEK